MSILRTFFAKDTDSYSESKKRIAACLHCKQITQQEDNRSLDINARHRFYCYNCSSFADINPCNCGYCESHPYNKTGLTKKDISKIYKDNGEIFYKPNIKLTI